MTKPLTNDISIRGFGKCLAKSRKGFETERGTVFKGDFVLVFKPSGKYYDAWWLGSHPSRNQSGTVIVDRRKSKTYIGHFRSRSVAESALREYFMFGYGVRPA